MQFRLSADFEELFGREHGADGGPAGEQPDVVQAAERRRLAQAERGDHLGVEREFVADGGDVGRRLDLAGEVAAERRRGVTGEQFANLVEPEQVERVSVHGGGFNRVGFNECDHGRRTPRGACGVRG